MIRENPKKGTDDGRDVAELVGSLERVEPPKDFDLRVKARIASAEPARKGGRFVPSITRMAVPAALLFVVGAFLIYTLSTRNELAGPGPIVETQLTDAPTMPEVRDMEPAEERPRESETAAVETSTDVPLDRDVPPERPAAAQPQRRQPEPDGMSEVRSASPAGEVRRPLGINPQSGKTTRVPPGFGEQGEYSVREVLDLIGLDAQYRDGAWTVFSTDRTGIAGRSGVIPGDRVLAVDNTSLTETTVLRGAASFNSLLVSRNGRDIRIELRNR
jgi:hypothetical protein